MRSAQDPKAREYVCKYAAKSVGFDQRPEDIPRWYLATKGLRLFACWGSWYDPAEEIKIELGMVDNGPAKCPHCEAVGTIFRARDGPFVWGQEVWRSVRSIFVGDLPETRPIPDLPAF